MIKPGKYTGFVLFVLSIFMMLDASMAFVFGERYMYWGLEYMPAWYNSFIIKIYESPRSVLWILMLAEIDGWVQGCFCWLATQIDKGMIYYLKIV